jgi:hypothetical protein
MGMSHAVGGMALERGSQADSGVFVGYRTASGKMYSMPFSKGISNDAERYSRSDGDSAGDSFVFEDSDIQRDYKWASDRFAAPGLKFEVTTPFFSIPDPKTASDAALRFASCPATFVKLRIENTSTEDW